jgi:CarD family transcriptional regulator
MLNFRPRAHGIWSTAASSARQWDDRLRRSELVFILPLMSSVALLAHPEVHSMQFSEGQTVVYPHHGPATVVEIFSRTVKGTVISYLKLEVHDSKLSVSVPVASADLVGIRAVLDASSMDALFDVLRAPTVEEETKWSRRMKDNQEKIKVGDIFTIAGVVRDLTRRHDDKGLSLAERDLLRHAQGPLITEIALSLGIATDAAETALHEALASGAVASPAKANSAAA